MYLDNLNANDVVAAAVAAIISVVIEVTAAAAAAILADVVATAATVRHRRRPCEVRLRARGADRPHDGDRLVRAVHSATSNMHFAWPPAAAH
jgi:hypothetical protein